MRKKKAVSQRQLATLSGLSQRMISYYETNAVIPPLDKLDRIASVLKCSVAELVDPNLVPKSTAELSTRTLKKVMLIEQLPPEDQRKVMAYVQDLLEKNQFKKGQSAPTHQDFVQNLEVAEPAQAETPGQ